MMCNLGSKPFNIVVSSLIITRHPPGAYVSIAPVTEKGNDKKMLVRVSSYHSLSLSLVQLTQ